MSFLSRIHTLMIGLQQWGLQGKPVKRAAGSRLRAERLEDRLVPAAGDIQWIHQFGGIVPSDEVGDAVAADGSVYVVGYTTGSLPGQASAGGTDAFVVKFDTAGKPVWARQFGSPSDDYAYGVAADASGVYVVGSTGGALPGQPTAGGRDAFVVKFDTAGNQTWARQFGSASDDYAYGVAADPSGVYLTGNTFGTLGGPGQRPGPDTFVVRYDVAGNPVWAHQFGSTSDDYVTGLAADATGVYVAGNTGGALPGQRSAGAQDAFVVRYDAAGDQVWTRQFGSASDDYAHGVAANASGVYVVGSTVGALPGQASSGALDAFVVRYDAAGNPVWTRQFGSSATDSTTGLAVDATGVYVTGDTMGTLPGQVNAGRQDVFVVRYDAAGNQVWVRQFGSASDDLAYEVAADAGGVYLTGDAGGALPGQASTGGQDAFVVRYDVAGNPVWTRQFGSVSDDYALALAANTSGVYVTGYTDGALPGQVSAGNEDAFLVKLAPGGANGGGGTPVNSVPTPPGHSPGGGTAAPPTGQGGAPSAQPTFQGLVATPGRRGAVTLAFQGGAGVPFAVYRANLRVVRVSRDRRQTVRGYAAQLRQEGDLTLLTLRLPRRSGATYRTYYLGRLVARIPEPRA
jgi:uncharacterized protein (UPF0548 family)